jgi:hypothetical protein
LGLTGGILDAFAYGNALTRVLIGGEADSLSTERANSETTNVLSMANMKRLYGFDEESVKAREGFFSSAADRRVISDQSTKGALTK